MASHPVGRISRRQAWFGCRLNALHPILVTGGSGQIGGAFVRQAALNDIATIAPNRTDFDLSNADSMAAFVRASKWSAIVSCAAYTAVDRAESEPDLARAINAVAPGILADEAARANIPIIHVSTDYVFDGSKHEPYVETDTVNPAGVYGRTKESGEAAVRAASSNHAIIRTAWVVSAGGANFINTMLRLGSKCTELSVINDQVGCPSSADDIALALLRIAERLGDHSGTWHFVNSGEASWYDLAGHVFAAASAKGLPVPKLIPISSAEYPSPAKRPANSRLNADKFAADFDFAPRPWQAAINNILAERLGS